MLPPDELKRRVEAARILRGMTQAQLADLVHADGLGRHDVGRLERGDLPLTRVLRDALCRHLGVPDTWFTDPSVDEIVGAPVDDAALAQRLDRIEALLLTPPDEALEQELTDAADEADRSERDSASGERARRARGRRP